MTNNTLDFKGFKQEVHDAVFEGVGEVMDFAKIKLQEKTPEDKEILVNAYDILPIFETGTEITGTIENNTPYGIYVEFGQTTSGKKYNYHKPKGIVFYRGVGARMLTKTYDNDQKEMFKILEDKMQKVGQ